MFYKLKLIIISCKKTNFDLTDSKQSSVTFIELILFLRCIYIFNCVKCVPISCYLNMIELRKELQKLIWYRIDDLYVLKNFKLTLSRSFGLGPVLRVHGHVFLVVYCFQITTVATM